MKHPQTASDPPEKPHTSETDDGVPRSQTAVDLGQPVSTAGEELLDAPSLSPPNQKRSTPMTMHASDRTMKSKGQGRFRFANGDRPLRGYTIKRGIGRGGFGEVYFAVSDAGKEVALKRIERNLDIELRGVRQCINLKHLNLVELWDICQDEYGETWVVMEYVPGTSLADVLAKHPHGMPEKLARLWFKSAAEGVEYLHNRGIVHRDLKPGNIFYDEDQKLIKIGDYGLSKNISHSRHSNHTQTVGTVHYMAPEIGKGEYGKGIDIYALGILLYEMLTGTVPFNGESTQEIIMGHLTTEPDLAPVPEPFRQAIGRALRKDPARRFASVREFMDALPWFQTSSADAPSDVDAVAADPPQVTAELARSSPAQDAASIEGVLIGEVDVELIEKGIVFGEVRESGSHAVQPPIEFIEPSPGGATNTLGGLEAELKDEPVAKIVRSGLANATNWWHHSELSTPLKIGLVVLGAIVMVANSAWLLPVAMVLAVVYVAYLGIRRWKVARGAKSGERGGKPEPASPNAPPSRLLLRCSRGRRAEEQLLRHALARRSWTFRASNWCGSAIIATVACSVFNVVAMAAFGSFLDATTAMWALYAWGMVVTLVASVAIMTAGEVWQSSEGDVWLRRLTMGCIGLALGIMAWFLARYLNIPLDFLLSQTGSGGETGDWPLTRGSGMPAYPIYFASLFLIVRWWRMADPLRRTRLSVWSVLVCAMWGAIGAEMVGLEPVRHAILAVVIATATQLASRWLPPDERARIVETSNTWVGA